MTERRDRGVGRRARSLVCAAALLVAGLGPGATAPAGAAATTGVGSGGGSRSGGGTRMIDALGAVGGGQAVSGGVRLLSGLIPSVTGITPVTLVTFTVARSSTGAPIVAWELSDDSDPVGFHVYGGWFEEGPWQRLNDRMLDAAARSYVDERPIAADGVAAERWYRLAAIGRDGGEVHWSLAVGITPGTAIPARVALPPNAPNPFRVTTTLTAELPTAGPVRLDIFDVAGRRVATLFDGDLPAGRHALVWNGDTATGRAASGIYWARLAASGQFVSRKIIVRR